MQRGSRKYSEAFVNAEQFHVCCVSQSVHRLSTYYLFPPSQLSPEPCTMKAQLKIFKSGTLPHQEDSVISKGKGFKAWTNARRKRFWWPNQQTLLGKVGEDVNGQRTMSVEMPSGVVIWLCPIWAELTGSSITLSGPDS